MSNAFNNFLNFHPPTPYPSGHLGYPYKVFKKTNNKYEWTPKKTYSEYTPSSVDLQDLQNLQNLQNLRNQFFIFSAFLF